MSRRLVPLALLVTALLVVAGLASAGRPLGGGGVGSGPSAAFFDYTFTTVVLAGGLLAAAAIWAWITERPELQYHRRTPRSRYLEPMVFVLACAAIAWALSRSGLLHRFQQAARNLPQQTTRLPPVAEKGRSRAAVRGARIRWDEVAIVLALLAGGGVAAYAASRRRPRSLPSRRASQAAVSAALDTSLDDLRAEPDLRRAIIAAYARMEHALAVAGLPRSPAEAPLEYLERALGELEASADAVRRLTDLFEWAKFSHHEPVADMRDEAIEALAAVRDELRAPVGQAAA